MILLKRVCLVMAIVAFFLFTEISHAQATREPEKGLDKFDALVAKKGTMLKFRDTNLSPIKLAFAGSAQTKIRTVTIGSQSTHFLLIEQKGQYRTETGSIAYDDLLDLVKALDILESDLPVDLAANPDYLENKYVTEDGFRLGYLIQKAKATWYLVLDDRGADNTIFVNDPANIRTALLEAKGKIEALDKIKISK